MVRWEVETRILESSWKTLSGVFQLSKRPKDQHLRLFFNLHKHDMACVHPHPYSHSRMPTSSYKWSYTTTHIIYSYMSFYKQNNLDLPYYTLSKKGEIYLREQLLERKGRLASVFLTSNMHEFDLSWNSKLTFYPRKL